MKSKVVLLILSFMTALGVSAQSFHGVTGFATYQDLGSDGVTGGGANAEIIHVSTRDQFIAAVKGTTPRVVILDADITGKGMQDMNDEVALGSNLTILGAGSGHALNGFCLEGKGVSNVIIRNITLTKGRTDGIAFHQSHHIWIDHCDLSDSYDGLLDITQASDYITISWVKLHNHNKVSITNSGTCHYEDYNKEHITFSHCWFANNTQRNPRIGYGKMHIYNCYWTDISSYCIGFHSQAQVQSQNNYFTSTANNPFCNQYSDVLPYCGYLSDSGSYFAKGNPGTSYAHTFKAASYNPATYYQYAFDQSATADVPNETAGIGPKADLDKEPILCPGNGAIQIPLSQKLSWSNIDGATAYRVLFGDSKESMAETDVNSISLQPNTTYYWQVIATVNGADYSSPVYQFTTATEQPTDPYPTVGQTNAWLRWPTSRDQFCTPLPLQWRPAADAKSYKVYVGTSDSDMQFVGETSALQLVPDYKFLPQGQTYYWRVDAVKNDGTTVTGTVWNFTPTKRNFIAGSNEVSTAYVSGIAFRESVSNFTGGKGVRGDQGPGCIHAVWAGDAGKYAIETTTYDQTLGPNLVGVSVNDQLIDEWLTSDAKYQLSTRKTRHTVTLNPGDEVRIDFVAGYVNGGLNESVAHIDQINFVATDADIIESTRKTGVFHSPETTKGLQYENLPISTVLFTDTLGTVGDKGSTQIKDMYASWISMDDANYTVYLMNCARVERVYSDGSVLTDEEDKTQNITYTAAKTNNGAELTALHFYKTLRPAIVYHTPVATTGMDCELQLTPDCIYLDTQGAKGDVNSTQLKDEYETWMEYTNPDGNIVTSKKDGTGCYAYINPITDAAVAAFVPKGSTSSAVYSYIVATNKYMTYYLEKCQRIKFYYSGSGGTSTNLYIKATDADDALNTETIQGDDAAGKGQASATVEMALDASKRWQVKIQATTGDMLVYACKMWPADVSGIINVSSDDDITASPVYNTNGQRVGSGYRGIILRNKQKYIAK